MKNDCLSFFIFALEMRYIHQHIGTILNLYKGDMPLANFLKFYFKKHPILGSRDRKILSEMAYCYYRCGKGLGPQTLSTPEKIDLSLLLSDSNLPSIVKLLPGHLQHLYGNGFENNIQALESLKINFEIEAVLEKNIVFSEGIDRKDWLQSMLSRPRLFLRIVPKYSQQVLAILQDASLAFELIEEHCIALANGSAIEKLLPGKMYRIQDASSQKTGNYFGINGKDACWDCCCGAGGKSLLLKELAPDAILCVSDVRKSILDNLAERFQLYGYQIPERLLFSVSDHQQTRNALANRTFNTIIADVPCSGSGTWARTPEQLYFFDPKTLGEFAQRQLDIAHNAIQYLKPNGTFIYITCSVFNLENEAVVNSLVENNPNIRIESQNIINGIKQGADSMFVAVLRRNN